MTVEPGSLRLELDGTACDGHGICMLCCPSRISLDEWGYAIVNGDPITDDRELSQARRAVSACPARALRISTRRRAPTAPGSVRDV